MSSQLVPANTDSYLGSISFTQLTAEQLAVAFRGLFLLKQLRLHRVGGVEQPLPNYTFFFFILSIFDFRAFSCISALSFSFRGMLR